MIYYNLLTFLVTFIVPVFLGVVYIFYPSGQKYFKKREYQKGIDEFKGIKEILLFEILLLFAAFLLSFPLPHGYFLLLDSLVYLTLTWIVIGGLLRIALLLLRKEFRFYFAKGCFNIIPKAGIRFLQQIPV